MFRSALTHLTSRLPGAEWAMIVGLDGVLLETGSERSPQEAELLAAEYATLLRSSRGVANRTALGELDGMVLATHNGRVMLQSLTPDYFLLLHVQESVLTGKALFEISRTRQALREDLSF
ncbi:MAG: roadblock/LC7 domain-containing protein [Acidobacteriota bacterium]